MRYLITLKPEKRERHKNMRQYHDPYLSRRPTISGRLERLPDGRQMPLQAQVILRP